LIPEIFADESAKSRLIQQQDSFWKEAKRHWKAFESVPKTKEGETLWVNLKAVWEPWRKNHDRIIQYVKTGKRDEALALTGRKADDSLLQTEKVLHELSQLNLKSSQKLKKRGEAMAFWQKSIVITGTIGGIVLALVFGFIFSRSIARPIQRIIHNLSETCSQIASTSNQIASANSRLAAGTSTQAAAVEEAYSVTAELSSNIQRNTQDVEKLKTHSEETSKVGFGAFEFFRKAKKATKEIKQSSEQTSKIVKTIGEIAFQTNLLALSAAIEAVQSNKVGNGFSVVAQEVRNLAMRSTEAANNTNSLIDENVKLITKGDDLLRASLGSFINYGEMTIPITTFSGTASEAAQRQAQGIEQINIALGEISRTAQSNVASTQQSKSVVQEINVLANSVTGIVSELKAIV
jgi:methyl-accepting chemotaxis protein